MLRNVSHEVRTETGALLFNPNNSVSSGARAVNKFIGDILKKYTWFQNYEESANKLWAGLFDAESVIIHDKNEVMRGLVDHYCKSARFSEHDKAYMIELYLAHDYEELQRFIDSVLYA